MSATLLSHAPRLRAACHVLAARCRPTNQLTTGPHAAHILITWRCNLRCTGCSAWQRRPKEELNADQWTDIFRQLRTLDIVKLIGGEPFAREDLGTIIEAIRREINPFVVQLVTNGTATNTIVAFAEQHAWKHLHLRVSLDGLGDVHDEARGVTGTFDRVMETLRQLARVRQHKRFQLAVNFTMTDDSLEQMQTVSEVCRGYGIDVVPGFKVKPFLRNCDLQKEKAETIGVKDHQAALQQMARTDHGARGGFNRVERLLLNNINRVVFRKQAAGGESLKFRCRELRNLIYLNPYGDIITCGLKQEPIGNIPTEGFRAVWTSDTAREARDRVASCPGCMQGAVEVMSNLYA